MLTATELLAIINMLGAMGARFIFSGLQRRSELLLIPSPDKEAESVWVDVPSLGSVFSGHPL